MTDPKRDRADEYTFETDLEAPPETVWRALSEPALREAWLGEGGEVVEARPPEELVLRWTEDGSPGLVTFRVRPAEEGGAHLTIVHRQEAEVIGLAKRRPQTVQSAWRMAA